ncbi:hypothetical protein F4678DRAFT_125285 [Xylaria arbuscula]|nr:hypothetical protein F4678DRAFT_125285 [Xylaria arbuscula]
MAPIPYLDKGMDLGRVLQELRELYKGDVIMKDQYLSATANYANVSSQEGARFSPKEYDPSNTVPRILLYLRDNDADNDANWSVNLPLIRAYIAEATHEMATGALGYSDPKLRAALEDVQVMLGVHLVTEKHARENTPWTTEILRGQTTQKRLLTYPKAFPLPEPDRSKSQHKPMSLFPRPDGKSRPWDTSLAAFDPATGLPILTEVDSYVEGENNFFDTVRLFVKTGKRDTSTAKDNKFFIENSVYEAYMRRGLGDICAKVPCLDDKPSRDSRGLKFYNRRGWQRAALQSCLNIFTSHENRATNTPWRRPVLPYEPPASLPKDTAYVPRVVFPKEVDEKEKDSFSWLHWSSEYTRTIDWLADCQRQRYNSQFWEDFSASALPVNFRGPRIYRGLTVHDQYWLRIGEQLENVESRLHRAWGAAPRPLLRAILRDIDAGRHENTGGPNMDKSLHLPAEDNDDMHDRKRYWRRDIKRRLGIDSREDNTDDENFVLTGDFEVSWLRYLCEPSRTLEMCDPSKLPAHNLAIVFDAKLQSFFRNLELSGTANSKALHIWGEYRNDIHEVIHAYKPNTLSTVLAYINGCAESELNRSGDTDPHPEHPNSSYQFSLDEAEFCCIELQQFGRCIYIPERGNEPARVDRPSYNVHPEDRITWRYESQEQFEDNNEDYLADMLRHYDTAYGNWSLYNKDRPRFARELEFMLDHAGLDFSPELERLETQDKEPGTASASARRQVFITGYIVPEGLCSIGDTGIDSVESEQNAPHRDDIAAWEAIGAYLTTYREQAKEQHKNEIFYYSGEPYYPQTPEKTVQFFRNLAYRMGRTLRYVNQIKERLQYLDGSLGARKPKPLLDLSVDLKQPRPKNDTSANAALLPPVAEKWWHAISTRDYDTAIENWSTTIKEGSGDVALLPPDIKEVLVKADPDSSFPNPLKGDQDPFTVIREGIIDDCFRNRPTMYPGRLSGFKDEEDKEFQGFERPNLFVWATKDQRRYQAQHTRRDFFNMQRWPLSRISSHRLTAIRERKDEVLRTDPSKPDQAYGILTDRLPIGDDKPLYAHPIIDHHHHHDPHPYDWDYDRLDSLPSLSDSPPSSVHSISIDDYSSSSSSSSGAADSLHHNNNNNNNNNVISINTVKVPPININPFEANLFKNNKGNMASKLPLRRPKGGLIPFRHSDEKFAPGPAIFPMGDTLLQKIMISDELNRAIYPTASFYMEPLSKLANVLKKAASGEKTLVPLLPPVAKSEIPRSNPLKRKMPIEFLNSSATTKKFRSDVTSPPQPGGSGGQFAAATAATAAVAGDKEDDIKSDSDSVESEDDMKSESSKSDSVKSNNDNGSHTGTEQTGQSPSVSQGQSPRVSQGQSPRVSQGQSPRVSQGQSPRVSQGQSTKDTKGQSTKDTKGQIAKGTQGQSTKDTQGQNTKKNIDQNTTSNDDQVPEHKQAKYQRPDKPKIREFEHSPLRVKPDPRPRDARKIRNENFPKGYLCSDDFENHMFSAGIQALEFGINLQLKSKIGLYTYYQELIALLDSDTCAPVRPYIDSMDNFDIFCISRLLEAFGEKHGYKLQLGVIHADAADEIMIADDPSQGRKLPVFLVGSKYHNAADKHVVWIRLVLVEGFYIAHTNPYSDRPYNNYLGVCDPSWEEQQRKEVNKGDVTKK